MSAAAALKNDASLAASTTQPMRQHSAIDFDRSHLVWTTKAGSKGYWRVIAAASSISSANQVLDQFVLSPRVMAGDVYGRGHLMHEPAYSFQIFASQRQHTILREMSTHSHSPNVEDSTAPNEAYFEKLRIELASSDGAKALNPGTISAETIAASWPLTAFVELRDKNGDRWQLEFPVNHINAATLDGKQAFQVETGPILVPGSCISPTKEASIKGGFALAYAFFNRSDRVDLSVWGPDPTSTVPAREFRHRKRFEAIVSLFGRATA